MNCAFCYSTERYNTGHEVTHSDNIEFFICSGCVQSLILLSPAKVIKLYKYWVSKGHLNKAKILKSLFWEDDYGERELENRKSNNRIRLMRAPGMRKKRTKQIKTARRTSLFKDRQKKEALSGKRHNGVASFKESGFKVSD